MGYQLTTAVKCLICKTKQATSRKLCATCYERVRRRGMATKYPVISQTDAFLSRIQKTAHCWLWQGMTNQFGYGQFLLPGEKFVRAHRYSYEHFVGPIPTGMVVMHTCDNPPCVNPKHLQVGTRADNNRDMRNKKRHAFGERAGQARLSQKQVEAIKSAIGKQSDIAKKYGITPGYVSMIKSGNRRKLG